MLAYGIGLGQPMHLHTYATVREAYDAWMRGDLEAFAALLADKVEFSVPSSPRTYVGTGEGRDVIKDRLGAFLGAYEVLEFTLLGATPVSSGSCDFRIRYHYRSRSTGDEIEGSQRHLWSVRDGAVTSFKVIHDADRLAAFFKLTEPAPRPGAPA